MEVYIDFENTIVNDENKLSLENQKILSTLARQHQITILTNSTLKQVHHVLRDENLRIVSSLENKLLYKNRIDQDLIPAEQLNKILENPYIYTAYSIEDLTLIYSYKHRLQFFYPNQTFQLIQKFKKPMSFLWVAVYNEGMQDLYSFAKDLTIEILSKDTTKTILKITKNPSTKEAWLLKLKKSPAIAIGDSKTDYDFIQHCEIQVAMKNADKELKALCHYQTQTSNSEGGAIQFLIDYLKRLPS